MRLEVRVAGRTLEGLAVPWGHREVCAPDRCGEREAWAPGSVLVPPAGPALNVEHDAGRTLVDHAETWADDDGFHVRAVLPAGELQDVTLAAVRSGSLVGLSVEFNALRESRRDGVRHIGLAAVRAVGLVATPAYRQTDVEARASRPAVVPPLWRL